MTETELREVDRFLARSDDGAYETEIVVMREFLLVRSMESPGPRHIRGLKEARTIDGFACNCIDDDTFEVVNDSLHPNVIVRRVKED